MRTGKNFFFALLLAGALAGFASAQTQTADQTQPQTGDPHVSGPVTTVNQAIDRVVAREHDEIATIRRFNPIIETYIQDMKPDKDMGSFPFATIISSVRPTSRRASWTLRCSTTRKRAASLDQFNPLGSLERICSAPITFPKVSCR